MDTGFGWSDSILAAGVLCRAASIEGHARGRCLRRVPEEVHHMERLVVDRACMPLYLSCDNS